MNGSGGAPAPGAVQMPSAAAPQPTAQPAVPAQPAPAAKPEPMEDTKSRLNPTDTAALDTLFSQLDDNYKTSYDLAQMTSQVYNFDVLLFFRGLTSPPA